MRSFSISKSWATKIEQLFAVRVHIRRLIGKLLNVQNNAPLYAHVNAPSLPAYQSTYCPLFHVGTVVGMPGEK
jgi:hypothetical protein